MFMKSNGDKTLSPYYSAERRKFVYTGPIVLHIRSLNRIATPFAPSHTPLSIFIEIS